MCWLFPGKLIKIATVCPDSSESISVEVRDGDVLSCNPEEHLGPWKDLIPGYPPSMTVRDRAFVQGSESRKHWLDEDYFSQWNPQRARERDEAMAQLDIGRP